jgi:hypothetical protein
MNKKHNIKQVSVEEFIEAISKLPSHARREHWIGWLSEYDEAGYYNRQPGKNRSARFSYNQMTSPEMLLWLIQAAGVKEELIKLAELDCNRVINKKSKSGAIRKHVPWEVLERALWRQK